MEKEKIESLIAADKIEVICDQANLLAAQEDYSGAIQILSTALCMAPFNATLRHIRGRKYIGWQKFNESIADLKLAVSGLPDDWECRYYLAVSYYLSGQYEFARKYHWESYFLMLKHDIKAIPAVIDWIWMSSMKLGDKDAALEALNNVDINTPSEDGDYLARVLLYKKVYTPDDFVNRHMCIGLKEERTDIYRLMLKYGLANYYRYIAEDLPAAYALYEEIAESEKYHNLFAYIQSQQELNS